MFTKNDMAELQGIIITERVASAKGKRAAARELSMSADTVSKYIDLLEYSMGKKILVVTNNHLTFTRFGKQVVALGSRIEREMEYLKFTARNISNEGEDSPSSSYLLVSVNGLELRINEDSARDLYERLSIHLKDASL